MRFFLNCGVTIALAAFAATSATASTPYTEQLICPIGGEKFEHTFTASFSTFGSRPDGKPYGSWTFPMPIPVCPSNKLPMYAEFSKEQLAKLEPLVASAEFRALSQETPYYRAAWLMERTGEKPSDVAWMIVKASWEADATPALKRKYQQDYVARLVALPANDGPTEWLALQARAANGMRELGRFDEAISLVDTLIPRAESRVASAKQQSDGSEQERAEGLLTFLRELRSVVEARNQSSEPIAMLPRPQARFLCDEQIGGLNDLDKAACNRLPAEDAS